MFVLDFDIPGLYVSHRYNLLRSLGITCWVQIPGKFGRFGIEAINYLAFSRACEPRHQILLQCHFEKWSVEFHANFWMLVSD